MATILDFAEWTVEHLGDADVKRARHWRRGARDEIDNIHGLQYAAEAARNYFRDLFRFHRGLSDEDRIFDSAFEQSSEPDVA